MVELLARAPAFAAALVVDILLVDFITPLLAPAPEFPELILNVLLVFGRDAGVDGDLGFVVCLGHVIFYRLEAFLLSHYYLCFSLRINFPEL